MLGISGIAVLVGFCTGGIALASGSSLLIALGLYVLSGWLFIVAGIVVLSAVKALNLRTRKQGPAYSG